MRYRKNVGIKEIALQAGVSNTTVSRVLRGVGEISEETRERIQGIAAELGYRPNLAVRTMQTGRSHTVGILMNVTTDPGFRGTILQGIHDTLIAVDHVPVVIWAKRNTEGFSERDQVHRLVDHRVDGIIMSVENVGHDFFRYVEHLDLPVVLIDELVDDVYRDVVITDNEFGGRTAARHLLELGHRNICFVTDRSIDVRVDGGRGKAFIDEVERHTDAHCDCLITERFKDGCAQIEALLASEKRPTAIFAFNDYVGSQTYRAAIHLGISVPSGLSIIGFGNVPNVIDVFPDLTSFEQEPFTIGHIASDLILKRLAQSEPFVPELITIPPRIVRRSSTAAPEHARGAN